MEITAALRIKAHNVGAQPDHLETQLLLPRTFYLLFTTSQLLPKE